MESIPDSLKTVIEDTIGAARVPGIVVTYAHGDGPPRIFSTGIDGAGAALTNDSLFPVASVTKLATALAVVRLADQKLLHFDDALAVHLPEAVAAQPTITLRKLLSHSAGMPADIPSSLAAYAIGLDWPTLAHACLQTEPATPPDVEVKYSNVGYGLLALVVERLTGQTFPEALHTLVLEPLGVTAYLGTEPPRTPVVLDDVRGRHKGTDLEPFNSAFWRSLGLPWAGLVTTVGGALAIVRAFRNHPGDFLQSATLAEATSNQVGDLGGGQGPPLVWAHCPWGLGPELRDAKAPHWGPVEASPASFGHAGASGCIAWADPATDVAWAFAGTRTADSGWLIRYGTRIGSAIIATATGPQST